MAIILILGNVGSGKTITLVRQILKESKYLPTYTNIHFNKHKWTNSVRKSIHVLDADMIIKKEIIDEKKQKFKYSFNIDFWEKQKRPLNIFIDEAGLLAKARKSMTHLNMAFQDFLALSRKISTDSNKAGDLILTSQALGLIDITCQILAHQIRYCVCYYTKFCPNCRRFWGETSEDPEPVKFCKKCGNFDLEKTNFIVRERRFRALPGGSALETFEAWKITQDDNIPYMDRKIYHAERFFPLYNTFQLKDMFSGYLTK